VHKQIFNHIKTVLLTETELLKYYSDVGNKKKTMQPLTLIQQSAFCHIRYTPLSI